jgi:hypothetical protein
MIASKKCIRIYIFTVWGTECLGLELQCEQISLYATWNRNVSIRLADAYLFVTDH